MTYYLDLPNPYDPHSEWINIMTGDREQVLAFIKNVFGGDEEGNINLLSERADEEDGSG